MFTGETIFEMVDRVMDERAMLDSYPPFLDGFEQFAAGVFGKPISLSALDIVRLED